MSRLISRLRFRQFGVFITTSYFHHQAYEEVRLDQHPGFWSVLATSSTF
jgi:hypothetical protein